MSKLKFTLPNILFWVGIFASCLLFENVAVLTGDPTSALSDFYFYVTFIIGMVALLAYQIFDRILNKTYADQFLLAIVLLCFAASMVAIWGFKGFSYENPVNPSKSFKYILNDYDKVRQSMVSFLFYFAVYSTLFTFSKNHPSYKRVHYLYILIILSCFGLLAFSLINEFDAYKSVAEGVAPASSIKSILPDSTVLSFVFILGILASIGLNLSKKNAFSIISILVFAIEIVFIGNLTSILIEGFLLAVYFLVEVIFNFKKSSKAGLASLSILILVAVSIVVMYSVALQYDLGNYSAFVRYLNTEVLEADYLDYLNRMQLWEGAKTLSFNNIIATIFGYGFRNSGPLLGLYHTNVDEAVVANGIATAQNGGLQVLLNFGFFGVGVYALFFGYYLYCIFRLMKKEPRFAIIYLIIGLGALGCGVTSSIIFMSPTVLGFLFLIAFYLPVVNHYKHFKKETAQIAIINNVKSPVKMLDVNLRIRGVAKLFTALTAAAGSFFVLEVVRGTILQSIFLNIVACLGACLLFVPFIVGMWSKNTIREKFVPRVIINSLIIAALFVGLGVVLNFTDWLSFISWSNWLYPILMGAILLVEVLIYGISRRGTFGEYAQTFIGMSKNSFMGLIAIGGTTLAMFFLQSMFEISTLTLILFAAFELLVFFIFSYFVPFKDTKEIVSYYNSVDASLMKNDVLDERLKLLA